MEPLICDGDVVVVADSSTGMEADWKRPITYPCVISHRGKVIVRLVKYGPEGTAIGPLQRSTWPLKIGKPDFTYEGALFPAGTFMSANREFVMLGRVVWAGSSLLANPFLS